MRPSLNAALITFTLLAVTTAAKVLASELGENKNVPETRNLQEDIDWAESNATQLANDLTSLQASLMAYYEHLAVNSAIDFEGIKDLLRQLQVDSTEITRLDELTIAIAAEIKLLIEGLLAESQTMEFQCIRIKWSLNVALQFLADERTKLEQNLTELMLDLSVTRQLVENLYNNLRESVLVLVVGESGPQKDEIIVLLDKIQSEMHLRGTEVMAQATKASQTGADLTALLDWIIAQLPTVATPFQQK